MRNVIVHDTRLLGTPAEGDHTVITVNAETLLESMIRDVRSCSTRHGTEIKLLIYAHGLTQDGHGGFGLQVCEEGINLATVPQLGDWAGMISYGIDIYCCSSAERAPGHFGMHGDGRLLCSTIARTTMAVVRAGISTQYYRYYEGRCVSLPINFGSWEGYVITYHPGGAMVDMQLDPAR